ncbi:hypothetical protein, variant [Puccinia striiformis f. sp. tritici PST-78]|uniref:Uncharacterized protein n=1 Tax=Puccinia striiformis f. sp. tritici PST-78 TaxID=1165861 RepID=A0A0L0UXA3_9BASI|nr:hypothetical protein, variant [Puccinia striiformis f. sp. tritici PST-78]
MQNKLALSGSFFQLLNKAYSTAEPGQRHCSSKDCRTGPEVSPYAAPSRSKQHRQAVFKLMPITLSSRRKQQQPTLSNQLREMRGCATSKLQVKDLHMKVCDRSFNSRPHFTPKPHL